MSKNYLLVLIVVICLMSQVVAFRLPPNGRINDETRRWAQSLAEHYAEGNLYEMIQARRARLLSIHNPKERLAAMQREAMEIHIPVVCGYYADVPPTYSDFSSRMQNRLFEGTDTTMRNFYLENSYNQFTVSGQVYNWVALPGNENEYVNTSTGHSGNTGKLIHDILDDLDNTVDFSIYDNDGDGNVENLCVVFSGPGQEYFGDEDTTNVHIWSHSSYLRSKSGGVFRTNDTNSMGLRVSIDKYTIQCETKGDGSISGISVFCHEFGHVLGLPDLYDIDYTTRGTGNWCQMASGSYNTEDCPAHFHAWCKEMLGWLMVTEITEATQNLELYPIETHPIAYKIWRNGVIQPFTPYLINGNPGPNLGEEYYLLEYRKRIGFDRHLNGEGLLISYINNTRANGSNSFNSFDDSPGVKIIQADGRDDLKNKRNSGDDGDVFPGSSDNRLFTDTTNPASIDYANIPTMVEIYDIGDPDTTIHFSALVSYRYPFFVHIQNYVKNEWNRLLPGRTDTVWFKLYNKKGSAGQVSISASSSDETVSFLQDEFVLDNVPLLDTIITQSVPLVVQVPADAAAGRSRIRLNFYNNDGFQQTLEFPIIIGYPELLVVRENRYVMDLSEIDHTMDSLALNYEYFDLAREIDYAGALTRQIGWSHRRTICLFGGDYLGAFNSQAMKDSIRQFIQQGGNLLISGGKFPVMIGRQDSVFFQECFHARYDTVLTNRLILRGFTNDPLSSNAQGQPWVVRLSGVSTTSSIQPMQGAQPICSYWGLNQKYGGIRYDNGAGKTVLFSIPLDAVTKSYDADVPPTEIILRMLDWFNGAVDIDEVETEQEIAGNLRFTLYPNPLVEEIHLRWWSKSSRAVNLNFFDLTGRKIWQSNWQAKPGWNEWTLTVPNLPSGIYFYRFETDSQHQTGRVLLIK